MNLPQILKLKYPNIDFTTDVVLSDFNDEKGPTINMWNLEDPIPTQEDLEQWAIDYNLQHRQQQAVAQRIYPSLGAQLDMMYHDKINNTTIWIDTIESIKSAHPKPTE